MKNKKLIIKSFTKAILSLFLLSGCANQVPIQPPAPKSAAAKIVYQGELPTISVNNLRMVAVNNFNVVNAEIINNEDDFAAIEYRFQWMDKNGMSVGTEENWTTLQFVPKQIQRIKGVSKSMYAVDFRLELKNKN